MNPDAEHLYTQLGRAYEMADEWEKARTTYETMLALARETREARLEVVALNYLANLAFRQEADPTRVRTLLEEAKRVAEGAGLTEVLAETECNLVDVMVYQTGEFGRFRPIAEKALASARALDRQHLVARALSTLTRLETWAARKRRRRTLRRASH